jgi:hypothetical protein
VQHEATLKEQFPIHERTEWQRDSLITASCIIRFVLAPNAQHNFTHHQFSKEK